MYDVDVWRVVVGGALLLYASISDIRDRWVNPLVWVVMVLFGVFVLIVSDNYVIGGVLFVFGVGVIVGLLLFCVLGFGGADVKGLWGVMVLTPFYPCFSLFVSKIFFPLVVLVNGFLVCGVFLVCAFFFFRFDFKRVLRLRLPFVVFLFVGWVLGVFVGDVFYMVFSLY